MSAPYDFTLNLEVLTIKVISLITNMLSIPCLTSSATVPQTANPQSGYSGLCAWGLDALNNLG